MDLLMEFRLLNIFHTGCLFGFTFYESPEEGYSYEVNIFMLFLVLQWKWYA